MSKKIVPIDLVMPECPASISLIAKKVNELIDAVNDLRVPKKREVCECGHSKSRHEWEGHGKSTLGYCASCSCTEYRRDVDRVALHKRNRHAPSKNV